MYATKLESCGPGNIKCPMYHYAGWIDLDIVSVEPCLMSGDLHLRPLNCWSQLHFQKVYNCGYLSWQGTISALANILNFPNFLFRTLFVINPNFLDTCPKFHKKLTQKI